MSSSGETKPPDLPAGRVAATTTTPIDLARVVVKPAALQENASVTVTAQPTHLALPRVQPATSVISATAASGQSIFTPSPSPASHLIVPSVAASTTSSAATGTAKNAATFRPTIRPLQPTPVIGTNVQKIIATSTITPQGVKAPTVVPHVRSPIVPVQQATVQTATQSQQNKQRPQVPTASLIRATNQFTTHVPRGPATVASITAGPKTAVATPIIRQTGGQNVVLAASHIPVGARASAAALTPTRAYAPVTMVELSKTQQSAGQLHLGIPPSITIEPGVRSTVAASGQKQTVYTPAIFQPIVSSGEKSASTTTFFKATGTGAAAQFNKGTTTFTPITTSQPQAVVQPVSNAPTTQAMTITSKVTVTNSNQFSKVANPVFVSNKANVSNVVITSQRPVSVRNVSTTQVTTTPNTNNLTIPMAKVYQQPLTVTNSEGLEGQPQPIGFMTTTGPRLQLPVISVGQNVQGTPPGAVVLTGDASRSSGTTQYMQPGTYLRYETYPAAYFSSQGGTSTPVQLTTAIPGVRTTSPFSSQRSLMVTVDAKVHPGTSTNNVISVTATKANNHTPANDLAAAQTTFNPDIAAGLQRISSETTITKLATPPPPPPAVTVAAVAAAVPTSVVERVTTTTMATSAGSEHHSTKLANLTEKVITQALSGVGLSSSSSGSLSALPITVTGIASSTNQVATIIPTNQQANQGSPSRPSILRKRPASTTDHFNALVGSNVPVKKESRDDTVLLSIKQELTTEDNNNKSTSTTTTATTTTTTTTPGNSTSDNHHAAQNGQMSPRKKPRKQILQSDEIEGTQRPARRGEENGKDDSAALNQRPQLFGGQQHGWKARLNHFLRHSDVRCRDDRKPSVNELANQKSAAQRAHGWKLHHIKGQVEEVETIESDAVHRFKKMLEDFETTSKLTEEATFGPDEEKMLNKIADLIKGNLQRSKIMQDQMIEVKKQLGKVLEHKGRVLDVIGKHVSKRPLKKREKL